MIPRLLLLFLCGAAGYIMLKGWPTELPALVRTCLAVLLLAGGLVCWASRKSTDEVPVASGAIKPGWIDFLVIGMGLLALESGFLWVLSVAPQRLESIAIVIEAKLQPDAALAREKSKTAEGRTGNWLWNDENRRILPRRTDLKPGARPEVFVRIVKEEDASALLKKQVYVRAFVLDQYQEGVWSVDESEDANLVADASGWVRMGGSGAGILHEVFHGKDAGGKNVLTALQGVTEVRIPSLRVTTDGMAYLPDISGPAGFEYLASSRPVTLSDIPAIDSDGLIDRGDGRLGKLALKAAGKGGIVERLTRLQNFLRDNYAYSLKTRNPRNLEPLENFLFEEKKGHCEFFATAGALMARELGVETRVAYGWAGGQYFQDNRMFVFRARDAHAWVEIKLKGYGWVVMEPTPPMVLGGGGVPRLADANERLPTPDETAYGGDELGAADENRHLAKVALWLMAVFGSAGIAMILIRSGSRSAILGGKKNFSKSAESHGYYGFWTKALERRGLVGARGLTLKRQLERVDPRPDFGEDLQSYHYALKYGDEPPDPQREGRLEKEIRRWDDAREKD